MAPGNNLRDNCVRASLSLETMAYRKPSQSVEDSTTKSAIPTPEPAPGLPKEDEVLTLAQACRDPYIVGELLLVIITITAILAVDVLILLENQGALHIAYACVANFVLGGMYKFSHDIRNPTER